MSEKVRGRTRESADGLRDRDRTADKQHLRESKQRAAKEASRKRTERKKADDGR